MPLNGIDTPAPLAVVAAVFEANQNSPDLLELVDASICCFGCRGATAIVPTAQMSWAIIGEPYDGLITLGLLRNCFDGCKE